MKYLRVLFFMFCFFVDCEAAPTLKDMVVDSLKGDISQKITATDFNVILSNWSALWEPKDFATQDSPQAKLTLSNLNIEDDQRRFSAEFQWDGGVAKKIMGTIEWMVSIPVLKSPLSPGAVIQESDITFQRHKADKLTAQIITKSEDIIGKTAKTQMLKMGTPINATDLQSPVLVKRGERVQVTYRSHALVVSASGVAKSQGCLGDMIPIESTPNKTIQAKVIGLNQTEVQRAS
jgi:flagella basal body P-ring formation protein FlgA